jgi:Xaa-Pro dipeptidase
LEAELIENIQKALKEAGVDGWLFYSFRNSDPIAANILAMPGEGHIATRRWFYLVPQEGEPTRIVHSIERDVLDHLPGSKHIYLPWQELHAHLKTALTALARDHAPRVAMQYSPDAAIPYLSRVDAGTIELIRSFGVEPVTSANLVQKFEAAWNDEQLAMHDEAARGLYASVKEAFAEIGRRIKANQPTNEYDIQEFIMERFASRDMFTNDPPIVAVNGNSAMPHYGPTKDHHTEIKEGDFVLIDLWAKLNKPGAVYADITWTSFVGKEIPEEVNKVFQVVRSGRDAAIEFVKNAFAEGRTIHGWQVDDVCRNVIREAGFGDYFIHRTGHSIHTEVHGNGANIDNLETKDDRVLIPRTCFSIEPGVYLEGKFGVRSEIDMYVGEGGEARVTGDQPQTEVVAILA